MREPYPSPRRCSIVTEKTLHIEWNGEPREIALTERAVTELAPGHYLVSDGATIHEVFEHNGTLSDGRSLDGVELTVESERERIVRERFKMTSGAKGAKSGAHMVKAPMPGLVRAIMVSAGDIVERNTTLLVLEAMKMENNILAGVKGRVEQVRAVAGTSVEKNAILIEIAHE